MYFISLKFIGFFCLFTICFFIVPASKRYITIALGNVFFYCFANAKYILLILFITILMYGGGLQ